MPESKLQKKIIDFVNSHKGCKAINLKANGVEVGTSDIIASIHGKNVVIELKQYKRKEKNSQRNRMAQWYEAKSYVVYVDNYLDFLTAFDYITDQYNGYKVFVSKGLGFGYFQKFFNELEVVRFF